MQFPAGEIQSGYPSMGIKVQDPGPGMRPTAQSRLL